MQQLQDSRLRDSQQEDLQPSLPVCELHGFSEKGKTEEVSYFFN